MTPIAARAAAESAAKDLMRGQGMLAGTSMDPHGPLRGSISGRHSPSLDGMKTRWLKALGNEEIRQVLESHFYRNNKYVARIDPDIGVLKSFSLNAKITFQRQRNVKLDIEHNHLPYEGPWELIDKMLEKLG